MEWALVGSDAVEKGFRGGVAVAGNEGEVDLGGAIVLGLFDQLGENFLFHSLAQYAATEEERVDVEGLVFDLEDHQSHQSIVAEAVADFDGEDFFSLLGEGRDIVFLATYGGGVGLVGALGELGEATSVCGSEAFEMDLELEFFEEGLVAAGLLANFFAGEHGLIHRGALAVFFGGGGRKIEAPVMLEKGGDFFGILRKANGGDGGEGGGDLRNFHRVVVDENKGVGGEVELLGEGGDVLGFGTPVDFPAHDVFFAKNHAGVLLEDFADIAFLVFGGEANDHAGFHARLEEVLESGVGFGDLELFGTDFGGDAGPKGGVGIDDKDFGWREQAGVNAARDESGEGVEVVVAVGKMAFVIRDRVEDVGDGVGVREFFLRNDLQFECAALFDYLGRKFGHKG